MTDFTSEVKTIPYNDKNIFALLSDLSNLDRVKDRIPQETIKNFSYTSDQCSFEVSPVGKIVFQIVNREPDKTIKFETTNSPVPLSLWIQLKPENETVTKMKMTIRAELNPFIKPMVSKPLQEALDKISTIIAALPYE
jgi:carbon monoxide dehydrogenase subunit G